MSKVFNVIGKVFRCGLAGILIVGHGIASLIGILVTAICSSK